jgi:hypothetical protein
MTSHAATIRPKASTSSTAPAPTGDTLVAHIPQPLMEFPHVTLEAEVQHRQRIQSYALSSAEASRVRYQGGRPQCLNQNGLSSRGEARQFPAAVYDETKVLVDRRLVGERTGGSDVVQRNHPH